MRQSGLKPKSHSSGVYWVRASKDNQGPKTSENLNILLWILILFINFILLILDTIKRLFRI